MKKLSKISNGVKEFKYFLDSNIFLRPIVKDDLEKVRDCERLLEKIEKGEIRVFTSNLVLTEIAWMGSSFYKIKKEDLIRVIKGILDFKNLKIIDNFDSRLAIELYEQKSVKFIDALIASNPLIFNKKAKVVSYDKDFDKLKIIRLKPKEIIS